MGNNDNNQITLWAAVCVDHGHMPTIVLVTETKEQAVAKCSRAVIEDYPEGCFETHDDIETAHLEVIQSFRPVDGLSDYYHYCDEINDCDYYVMKFQNPMGGEDIPT